MHHRATASDGTVITPCLVRDIADRVSSSFDASAGGAAGGGRKFRLAGRLTSAMMTSPELDDFLTSVAYPHIVDFSQHRL